MLIIRKKNGSISLFVALVSVALFGFPAGSVAKTPLSADSANKIERELQQLTKGSDKEGDSKDTDVFAWERKAEESLKSGKYSEAIEHCSKALAINPEDLHAYRLRSIAYMRFGDQEKAKEDQAKLISLQEQISQRNSKEEIAKYSALIKDNPKNAKAFADRAAAYMSLEQYDDAITDSTKAISLDPTDKYAYFTRMAAYKAKRDTAKALADRQKFQELDRSDKMRLSSSAVSDYSRLLDSNPSDTNALLNRARAYFELGQFVSAQRDCDSLLKLKSDLAEVKEMRNRCQKEIRQQKAKKEKSHK